MATPDSHSEVIEDGETLSPLSKYRIRYWGAEFDANPGSDKYDYFDEAAGEFGREAYVKLTRPERALLHLLFREGVASNRQAEDEAIP